MLSLWRFCRRTSPPTSPASITWLDFSCPETIPRSCCDGWSECPGAGGGTIALPPGQYSLPDPAVLGDVGLQGGLGRTVVVFDEPLHPPGHEPGSLMPGTTSVSFTRPCDLPETPRPDPETGRGVSAGPPGDPACCCSWGCPWGFVGLRGAEDPGGGTISRRPTLVCASAVPAAAPEWTNPRGGSLVSAAAP